MPHHRSSRVCSTASLVAMALCSILALAGVAPRTALAAGLLVPSGGDRGGAEAIRMLDHLVATTIDNRVALTTINQIFENTTGGRLEATYIFPIPNGADLTDFRMTFNGKMVEGEVLPAEQAKQIYEDIVRRKRDPGLIEFIGQRLLQARIFPIEPHSKTEIQLSYQQLVEPTSGMWRYRYPLRTPGENDNARSYGTVRFTVSVETEAPLKTVWSPTHTVEVVRDGEHKATVAYESSDASLDDDFELLFDTDDSDVGLSLIAHRPDDEKGEPGHFLLLLSPKALWDSGGEGDGGAVAQDYVFVVDTSGSMAKEGKIDQVKEALGYCVDRLEEGDRFSIIRFSTGYDALFEDVREVTDERRRAAHEMIDGFKASGGTNIHDALRAAARMRPDQDDDHDSDLDVDIDGNDSDDDAERHTAAGADGSRPFIIVFLTDGQGDRDRQEIEAMLDEQLGSRRDSVRIFPFGVGYEVNTKLLDSLATKYGGAPTYVQPEENLEYALGDFFAVFSRPALTNLELSLPDAGISEKYPPEPGDLYQGRQIVIAGQFDEPATGPVTLTARRGGRDVRYTWADVKFASTDDADYVPRIWAGRKIAYLIDRIRLTGESDELIDEVVSLSREYGIQTPYSSWLVVPESEGGIPAPMRDGRFAMERARQRAGESLGMEVEFGGRGMMREGAGGFRGYESMPAADDVDSESGAAAMRVADALAEAREMKSLDAANRNHAGAVIRRIGGRDYFNFRGFLVDTEFGAEEKVETIEIKFGSDAYFELAAARPDLRKALAASRNIIVMADDEGLAIAVRSDGGIETLDDAMRERIAK